ncbi:MAG: 1-acyl-sn-glycerol-3-phosphate acyltransferase [Acidobacteria bacterium]|nr:1-acyl-sn-glycerol-3-phosphate acyltransferase [Acidobacteriota bacterium]
MVWAFIRSTFLILPALLFVTAVATSIAVTMSYLSSRGRTHHKLARIWALWILRLSGVRVEVQGQDNVPPGGNFVFAANHRSFYDIPAVLPYVNAQFRFLAKKSLFYWPFIGNYLRSAGHLPVHYDNARESLKTMSAAARKIQEHGISILLFPEAGRTLGQMDPFKDGAAYIAIKAGVPIVPIGILGAGEILPIHGRVIRPGPVTIRIGKPIPTIDLTLGDRTKLTQTLYQRVCELCDIPSFPGTKQDNLAAVSGQVVR